MALTSNQREFAEYYQSQHELMVIENALQEIEMVSCVRFLPAQYGDEYYVEISSKKEGCFAQVGRSEAAQVLNLGKRDPYCIKHHIVLHEALHSLGFSHQQSSHDRDDYVKIHFENINGSKWRNFEVRTGGTNFGVPYDYKSLMHYSQYAGTCNGKPTITALQPGFEDGFGNKEGLTDSDILKLNRMYECDMEYVMPEK